MADKKKALFVEATQLIRHGKYGQASKVLKDLLALEPSNIEFRRLSASLNLKLGNMMAAKGAYEELVKDAFSMRDSRLAESMLREYLAVGPRCVPFLEQLGHVCEENGNAMVAATEYSKALQILLDDPDAGDASKPKELFTKIKELAPNNPILIQYATQFEQTQAIKVGSGGAALDQTTRIELPLDQTTKLEIPTDATIKLDIRNIKPAPPSPPTSPLETTLKMKAMQAGKMVAPPAPPAPPKAPTPLPVPPVIAVPPPPVKPVAPPPPPVPPVIAAPPPVKSVPPPSPPPVPTRPTPAPPPPVMDELPLVDDDISELMSHPIPKRTEIPERPSIAKTILNFFQSAPPPPAPPPVETVVPTPEPPAAVPAAEPASQEKSWKPWQAEPAAAPPASPSAPASEPQGVPWQPWQPEATAAAPAELDPLKLAQTASRPAPPKKTKSRQEKKPSLSVSGGGRPVAPLGVMTQTGKHRRAATLAQLEAMRRKQKMMARVKKVGLIVGIPVGSLLLVYASLILGSLVLEQGQSEVYQNLSGAPPRSGQDPRRNAYVLLLGFGVDPNREPMADGFERMEKTEGVRQPQCSAEPDPAAGPLRFSADTALVNTAWYAADPVAQFMSEATRVNAVIAQHAPLMNRYRDLLTMKFVDEGFGKLAVPNCALILTAHRLYVAEGFGQGLAKGIERLKEDLTMWRGALSQARTLPIKQLAFAAFNDDLTILAGIFNRPEIDNAAVSDLAGLAKPLEQFERSLRWPVQNALAIDAKLLKTDAIFDAIAEPTPTVQLLAHLPLPDQRTLNGYADYYEAVLKSIDAPLAPPPKLYKFARTPPRSLPDYVLNPIDNLIPGRMAISWEEHVGTAIETDARLRLVGLVALLRGLPRDVVPGRIAQAGQNYYDPFMEITMLLDFPKGKLYSVGKNRIDDDADPILDVTVPFTPKEASAPKPKKR